MTSLHSLCTVTSWLVPYKIPLFTLARHIFSHVLRTTDFMITVFLQQFAIMSQTTKCVTPEPASLHNTDMLTMPKHSKSYLNLRQWQAIATHLQVSLNCIQFANNSTV